MGLLIGIDVGTTTIKAIAYDVETQEAKTTAIYPTPVSNPYKGCSEHDPDMLWNVVADCLRKLIHQQDQPLPILGISISSFGDTGVVLDQHLKPISPILTWYDSRGENQIDRLHIAIPTDQFRKITGQRVSTSLGISKWLWLQSKNPHLSKKMRYWLSVPDFILWKLTGEFATDFSIASRTGFFNQATMNWSTTMLNYANITSAQLPHLYRSGTVIGKITSEASNQTGVPVGVPCAVGGHDHLCAALVTGANRSNQLVDSCGTAQSLLVPLDRFPIELPFTERGYACYVNVLEGGYVLRGGLRAAGGILQWLTQQLAGNSVEPADLPYEKLIKEAGKSMKNQTTPLWLPHLMGSGTPLNDPQSYAALIGLSEDVTRGDLFRSLLESLAFWLRFNIQNIEDILNISLQEIYLLGGVTRIEILSQIKADVINRPVILPEVIQASATGAALLAGAGVGIFTSAGEAAQQFNPKKTIIEPNSAQAAWYVQLYEECYIPLYEAVSSIHHRLKKLNETHNPINTNINSLF